MLSTFLQTTLITTRTTNNTHTNVSGNILLVNYTRTYTHARTHTPAIMEDYGYEVAAVKATRVPSGNIDKTFRSGYIGK